MPITKESIRVSRVVAGGRLEVFEAWTRPETARKWYFPEDCSLAQGEMDVRVGGAYRAAMKCGSEVYTATGVYREIAPGRKLVFTHGWEGAGRVETLVTVEFNDKDGGTEVVLTQEGFAGQDEANLHQEGWAGTLRNLERLFSGGSVHTDARAIRDLVQTWLEASSKGDTDTLLGLMTDDVIFMVPGREPFGKAAFAARAKELKGVKIESKSDIREIEVLGDQAWMRNHLRITITPPNGKPSTRSGYVLTILRKKPGAGWLIARDANLLA